MTQTHVSVPYDVTEAELVEKAKLKKHFGRFDILFFLICTLVGVDTIGTVASNGAEAFTWLMLMAAVFFIPSALLFAEMGTAFPRRAVLTSGSDWPSADWPAPSTTSCTGSPTRCGSAERSPSARPRSSRRSSPPAARWTPCRSTSSP